MDFTPALIHWYKQNKRDLPWRKNTNPYLIWLSEIILQQTRVDQGTSYFLKFAEAFPTVYDLANASEQEVMKLWQGLGYYSRARNLHETAKNIVANYKGEFPRQYDQIIKLKGIGPYTAAAIASIAFEQPYPAIDGNVYRVLSRVFGIHTPIDSSAGKRQFADLANELIDPKQPSNFNQGMMEFGAMVCTPTQPRCNECIFSTLCIAHEKQTITSLPVKAKVTKVRNRYFHYLVFRHRDKIAFKQRLEEDIWKNMYDFPLIESVQEVNEAKLVNGSEWSKLVGKNQYSIQAVTKTYKHVLTHQRIYAKFLIIDLKKPMKSLNHYVFATKNDIRQLPLPRLIDRFMIDHF